MSWRSAALPVLALALFVALAFAAAYGAVSISPLTSAAILLNQTHIIHFTPIWPASDETILLLYRLPRVVGAALVGAALGVAGVLFQGLLRNPLADPLLLGTSSGAALGATIAFVLPPTFTAYWFGFEVIAVLAFAGALLAVGLVYLLATRNHRTPVVTLLLAGVAVSAVLTAAQTMLITLNDRLGLRLVSLYRWITGSISVESWTQAQVVAVLVVAGIVAGVLLAPALDAFALGEEMAGHLGLRVERYKLVTVLVAALLVGAAVSISGIVGFVGLVAPHLCRLTLGPRHRLLVPASALAGAIFVVVADLLARILVAPAELPLGVLTALVGGPFFLWLLRAAGTRYRW
ncbi:MAG TPA: iron ABC transporter permease [Ktedonobacterales bacterium]|nr:iron ABC transporter permease [Ktedonobacterales bacterium]